MTGTGGSGLPKARVTVALAGLGLPLGAREAALWVGSAPVPGPQSCSFLPATHFLEPSNFLTLHASGTLALGR